MCVCVVSALLPTRSAECLETKAFYPHRMVCNCICWPCLPQRYRDIRDKAAAAIARDYQRAVTASRSDDTVHAEAALLADIHYTKRERMMPRDRSRWCLRASRGEWLPRRRRRRRDARCDVTATSCPYLGSPLTGWTLATVTILITICFSRFTLPLSIARRSLKICTKVRIAACISRDRNAKHCWSNSELFD